jgi:hypothetical protein
VKNMGLQEESEERGRLDIPIFTLVNRTAKELAPRES